MGLFESLVSGGFGQLLGGIGQFAKDIRQAITGELAPEKKAEIEMKLLEIEFSSAKAQAEINLAEARHASVFVAGWRPAIGWVCALGLAWQFLVNPILIWLVSAAGMDVSPPLLQTGELYTLVLALLGLGGMRTYEKLQNIQGRH